MNEDYLWDRTGEPDEELQQLEELLGELRYQPRPLQLPNVSARRSRFLPAIAIAATLLIAIGIGIWLNLNRRSINQTNPQQVRDSQPEQTITPAPDKQDENLTATYQPRPVPKPTKPERRQFVAYKHQRPVTRQPELTAEELAQKEQVVFALRMVSTKLNLAQRKTQGTPQANIIRNQHKIG